jgi:hypothetical protein
MGDKVIELSEEDFAVPDSLDHAEAASKKKADDDLLETSKEFAADIVKFVNGKLEKLETPIPIAVILNAMMFIYVSTVLNSIPRESRLALVVNHFDKVVADMQKASDI